MNRQEFMRQLEYLLRGIPANERMDALAYYNDYFDEAGLEKENQVIQELGSPESVAQTILADVQREMNQSARQDYGSPEMEQEDNSYNLQPHAAPQQEKKKMSTSTKILISVLLIFTFPLWIGIVAGLFGGLVGLLGALFGVIAGLGGSGIGLVIGGIAYMGAGALCIFAEPVEGLVCVGVGALLASLGVLLALLCILIVGVWLPKLVKALVKWIKGLRHRNEGGDEI